jgi:CBS domain containing-hemolysin-like protein
VSYISNYTARSARANQIGLGFRVWEVAGNLPLHELGELIGEPLVEEGITTTSGLVTHRLGGFPKVGDVLTIGRCELRGEKMDGPRVAPLNLMRLSEAKPGNQI